MNNPEPVKSPLKLAPKEPPYLPPQGARVAMRSIDDKRMWPCLIDSKDRLVLVCFGKNAARNLEYIKWAFNAAPSFIKVMQETLAAQQAGSILESKQGLKPVEAKTELGQPSATPGLPAVATETAPQDAPLPGATHDSPSI